MEEAFPDMEEAFPSMEEAFPDMEEAFPSPGLPRYSQSIMPIRLVTCACCRSHYRAVRADGAVA